MSEKKYDVILHTTHVNLNSGSAIRWHEIIVSNVSFGSAYNLALKARVRHDYHHKFGDRVSIREHKWSPMSWSEPVKRPLTLCKRIKDSSQKTKFAVVFKHQGIEVSIFAFSRKELAKQYCKELTKSLKPWSRIHFFVKEVK